jgi:hypothetical protein
MYILSEDISISKAQTMWGYKSLTQGGWVDDQTCFLKESGNQKAQNKERKSTN